MATSTTFTTVSGQTVYITAFGSTDKDLVSVTLDGSTLTQNVDYTVAGVSDTSNSLTITLLPALTYSAGQSLVVTVNSQIANGSPEASMLTDFTSTGTITPLQLQNEFTHVMSVFRMVFGADTLPTSLNLLDISTIQLDVTNTYFDASTKQIKNIVDPTANQDAATKLYTDTADSALQTQITTNLGNINSNDSDIADIYNRAMLQSGAGADFNAEGVGISNAATPTGAGGGSYLVTKDYLNTVAIGGALVPNEVPADAGKFLQTDGTVGGGGRGWSHLVNLTNLISWNLTIAGKTQQMDFQQGYALSSVDQDWAGGAGTTVIIDGPDGGDFQIGPTVGSFGILNLKVAEIRIENATTTTGDTLNIKPLATGMYIRTATNWAILQTTASNGITIDSGAGAKKVWDDGNTTAIVTTAKLADGSVTVPKLVTGSKILHGNQLATNKAKGFGANIAIGGTDAGTTLEPGFKRYNVVYHGTVAMPALDSDVHVNTDPTTLYIQIQCPSGATWDDYFLYTALADAGLPHNVSQVRLSSTLVQITTKDSAGVRTNTPIHAWGIVIA